jgi:hypothetical protein
METERSNMGEWPYRCDQCGADAPKGSRWCSEECYLEYKEAFDAARERAIDTQIDARRLEFYERRIAIERMFADILGRTR